MDSNRNDEHVRKALEAAEKLLRASRMTDLDRKLFSGYFTLVKEGSDVSFPDSKDREFHVLRASRLKLLGYRWRKASRGWHKPDLS